MPQSPGADPGFLEKDADSKATDATRRKKHGTQQSYNNFEEKPTDFYTFKRLFMRGTKKFCQRGSNSDNVFVAFCEGRESLCLA